MGVMSKSWIALRCRVCWALAMVAASPAAAQSVLEIKSNRQLEFATQRSLEKSPVITAVAIDSLGQRIATAGDNHRVLLWNTRDGGFAANLRGTRGLGAGGGFPSGRPGAGYCRR